MYNDRQIRTNGKLYSRQWKICENGLRKEYFLLPSQKIGRNQLFFENKNGC